jgi:hypothetical protein
MKLRSFWCSLVHEETKEGMKLQHLQLSINEAEKSVALWTIELRQRKEALSRFIEEAK